jgi:predicted nucleic acid-binding protein
MKVVVDTNILFSAFLSENSRYRDLFFQEQHDFYAPNFVFLEIFKHKEKILKCTKESEEEVYGFLGRILKRIGFVKEEVVSVENYEKANILCREIDENDAPFVALAIELEGYLLTGDEMM